MFLIYLFYFIVFKCFFGNVESGFQERYQLSCDKQHKYINN